MERVLVIGGAGYLGRHLVEELLEGGGKEREVTVLDLASPSPPLPPSVHFIRASILDKDAVLEATRGKNVVFHLASLVDLSPRMTEALRSVNVRGTQHVLDSCLESGVERLVYTSTLDTVFDGSPRRGEPLDDVPYPSSHLSGYITSKIMAERLVVEAHGRGLLCCILRPAHIYGPQDLLLRLGIGRRGVRSPIRWPLPPALPRLSMVYVKNVAHAHVVAAERLTREISGQAFMIAEGTDVNQFDYIARYASLKGLPSPSLHVPFLLVWLIALCMEGVWLLQHSLGLSPSPPLFTRLVVSVIGEDLIVSYDKARRVLGYRPKYTFEQGFEETMKWWSSYQPTD